MNNRHILFLTVIGLLILGTLTHSNQTSQPGGQTSPDKNTLSPTTYTPTALPATDTPPPPATASPTPAPPTIISSPSLLASPTPKPGEEGPVPGVVAEIDMGLPAGNCYFPTKLSLDEETGLLYVVGWGSEQTKKGCISILDMSKGKILDVIPLPERFTEGLRPMSVVGGRIYFSFYDKDVQGYQLAVIDTASNEIVAVVPIEGQAQSTLIDLAAERLYLTISNRLEIRSATDLSPITSLPLEARLVRLALDSGVGKLYLALDNRIEVRDVATLDLLDTWPDPIFPETSYLPALQLKLSTDGERLYGMKEEDLVVFDTTTGQLLTRLDPYDGDIVAWGDNADRVYFSSGKSLMAVDLESGEPLAELALATTVSTTLWDSHRGILYVAYRDRHSIVSVDLAAMKMGDEVPVGIEIKELIVDSSTDRIYLGDSAGQVHILDSNTYEHLASLPGRGQLTLDAANQRLYASYGGEVTVLDLKTLRLAGTISAGGHISVDSERNRVFVGRNNEEMQVFDGATLTQIATVPQSGIPTYNPVADELYIVNTTAHIVDGDTLELTGDLTPDITATNEPCNKCNGMPVVTAVKVYPERNLLVVHLTTMSAGKGPGYYPAPRFFDATTRQPVTHPVTLEATCLGELITDPIDGRIYDTVVYSRYVHSLNLVVYDEAGQIETWLDGIGYVLPNPLTKQAYIPQADNILVLDLETLTPIGTLPPYCLHTLDFSTDRLYAVRGETLTVLSSKGGYPLPPLSPEPGVWPDSIAAIYLSPNYATDKTIFVVGQALYRSTDGGEHWLKLKGGLPNWKYNIAFSPAYADDHTLFAWSGFARGSQPAQGLGVYRSTDGGETWQPRWNGLTHLRVYDVVISPEYATDRTLLAYADFWNLTERELDGESLFRSTDGGEHWNLVEAAPHDDVNSLPKPNELLPPVAEPKIRFRHTRIEQNSVLERSTDGGRTWETVSVLTVPPSYQSHAVLLSPNFAADQTLYVWRYDGLIRSTDAGETWQSWTDERLRNRDSDDRSELTAVAVSPALENGQHQLFIGTAAREFWALAPNTMSWETLPSPTLQLNAQKLVEQGQALARHGQVEEAVALFQQALELDPGLEHNWAASLVDAASSLAQQGQIEEAVAALAAARATDANVIVSITTLNRLCWFGSLYGYAAEVLAICEQAVESAPDDGAISDSRGLARALTGDYAGAINDFEAFVAWTKENGRYERYGTKREAWIAELKAGQNPFDEETLEALREE